MNIGSGTAFFDGPGERFCSGATAFASRAGAGYRVSDASAVGRSRQGRSDDAGPGRRLLSSTERPYRGLHAGSRRSKTGRDRWTARIAERAASLRWRSTATFSLYALHRFNHDGCFAASGALSYTTLVSLVPLGVIGLGILSAFPIFAGSREELLQLLFRNFVPASASRRPGGSEYFAGSAAQATAIGIVGTAAIGVLLLVTVEDQLNALWRVTAPRPWVQRILAYWTLITMGPLLVGMSLTLSTYLDTRRPPRRLRPGGARPVRQRLAALLRAAGAVPARIARLRAALLHHPELRRALARRRCSAPRSRRSSIEILKIGFSIYIGSLSSYQTVYGAIATIPIFLLWMYVSWMAVLLGAVVAANLPTWRVDERLAHLSSGGVRLGFSLALIAALDRGRSAAAGPAASPIWPPSSASRPRSSTSICRPWRAPGSPPPTQDGRWVLAWNPETATLHDLYLALGLPLAGTWLARPLRAVADAGRAGDGADHQGRGGGDAGDARLRCSPRCAARRAPAPAAGNCTTRAGATGCRARRASE